MVQQLLLKGALKLTATDVARASERCMQLYAAHQNTAWPAVPENILDPDETEVK